MKKELTEKQKANKLKKLKKSYDAIDEQLKISSLPVIDQIHKLVDEADKLQGEICEMSDDIKIGDLLKAQDITSIDKKTYLDFVHICSLKNNDKLHAKAIDRFENDFNNKLFLTNLRHSFLESYMSGNKLKITDKDNEEYVPFSDYESNEFDKIMQESAKKREYINTILRKKYKVLSEAAEYITNLELFGADFKSLVDWQHYKNGGYPTPSTPSKIWSIYDRFTYAHNLLTKYKYDTTLNKLDYEFGLHIEETDKHKITHPWQEEKEE